MPGYGHPEPVLLLPVRDLELLRGLDEGEDGFGPEEGGVLALLHSSELILRPTLCWKIEIKFLNNVAFFLIE